MKILMLASETPPVRSGVALTVQQLRRGYRRAGHQVELLSRRHFPLLTAGEIRLSSLGISWSRVDNRIRTADVVHLHGPSPTFSDAILLRLAAETSLVYTHHFDLDLRGLGIPCALYNRWHAALVARRAQRIVTTSEDYRHRFPDDRRLRVIPWGGDHRALAQPVPRSRSGTLRVLFVGQMRPYKGVEVLLEALRDLDGVRADLVGDGRLLDRYRRRAQSDRLSHVSLPGRVDDATLEDLFARADVIVLPSVSRMEAFGIVLLEGMRSGCVPIASRLPGVRSVIGDTGRCVTPGRSDELRAAIVELRDDAALRGHLSAAARQHSGQFRWADTVTSYLELLTEVASARPRPTR